MKTTAEKPEMYRKYNVVVWTTKNNKSIKEYVTGFNVSGNAFAWSSGPDPDKAYRISFNWKNACAVNAWLGAMGQQPQVEIAE